MQNILNDVGFSDGPGCEKFSDENSRDVEEEDEPEDKKSCGEVQSSVERVGRRGWRIWVRIVPPNYVML